MKWRYIFMIALVAIIVLPYFMSDQPPAQTLYVSSHFANAQEAKKTFIKQKPMILWDLHGVLWTTSKPDFFTRGVWNIEHKPTFLFQFAKALCSKEFWKVINFQRTHNAVVTQAYFEATRGYDHLYKQLISFANNIYQPNKETYALIRDLEDEGYQQFLFSNIGPVTLEQLQLQYPQYFTSFEQLSNSFNTVTPAYDRWIGKPQTAAFIKTLNFTNSQNKPYMTIFVDDHERNIKKAHEMGMNGIIFVSAKQLKKDINQLLELN